MSEKESKKYYRFPPCPVYDIEGTESWLESMAEQGFFLQHFFAGFAVFEKKSPQVVRYRMQAAPKSTSMWSDSGGEPDPDAIEFGQRFGWEYLCKRWQFYIYFCSHSDARELDTDPQVQAMALDLVQKRERGSMLYTIFWILIYPVIFLSNQLLLTIAEIGTPLFLLGTILVIWGFFSSLSSALHLRKLKKQLLNGTELNHKKNWRPWATFHRVEPLCFLILLFIWLGGIFYGNYQEYTEANEIPLQDYTNPLPFATMADLRPDGTFTYDNSLGLSNKITVKTDFLIPVSIHLLEDGQIDLPNGTSLTGGLVIEYYQASTPFLSKELFRELLSRDRKSKHYEPLPFSPSGVEKSAVYSTFFPTVLLQKGNEVLYVSFYQTSPENEIPLEEWVSLFADSLQN